MDSSSSSNWLAFSLSNPLSSSSHFPLFPSFTSSSPTPTLSLTGNHTVDAPAEAKDGAVAAAPTSLSMFTGGPKFEDFLGGTAAASAAATTAPAPTQFPADNTLGTVVENEIYDSELKTIAASFLRGFAPAGGQAEPQQKQTQLIPAEPSPKKSVDTFGQRTSIYRGVTRHRWTGRYEAHLWDNSCRREGQSRKGRQVYLGGYDKEEKAARAYDLAALKYWGPTTTTNFPISNYQKELEEMKNMTRQEFVASLRRRSSGFSRGASIYRGVTRHHQHGRWQARIGRVAGNKDLYLGTFSTQEEAAEAYDIAAIKFRGINAVTNFDMSRYDVKSIANSSLPIGGLSGKTKNSTDSSPSDHTKSPDGARSVDDRDLSSANSSVTFASQPPPPPPSSSNNSLTFAIPIKQDTSDHHYWSSVLAGYNKNPSLIQPSSSTNGSVTSVLPFNVDLSTTTPSSTSMFVQQQQQQSGNNNNNGGDSSSGSSSLMIPLATPIALNSNPSYESSSGYGNWSIIGPTLHTFQTHAKTSLFQTPIFGME
ncbi:AP2-like ethylene-responsive transcription factor AIL5 [Neltuma alba]|uniref:AP2-like ethylene-responsive transcription factor AIL5 n=1 Tax=Neltuma alba TaxID=207710 RepID=UPI0010A55FBC|nr:AP2-like ethylene-responsive transcription factor AIL5 [Prosopis alba]XP_028787059.1 AP2-like ethylene-responsive transcription factor AIL5 [Prosopis alba]